MLAYIARRILATIPVMLVVAFFVFSLLYLAPGDPAAIIAGDQATPADVERIRASLGLDRPFLVRFGEWLWQIMHGDLGTSIFTNLPVSHMIAQRIEPTLSLMVLTIVFSIVVAIPLGVLAAWKHGTWIDRAVMVLAVFGFSVAGVRARLCAGLRVRAATRLAAGAGLPLAQRRIVAVPAQPDPADGRARPGLHRAARAHHARDDARSAEPGLCAHREGEGRGPARRPVRARAEERRGADRHRDRHRRRAADRRRGDHRKRVRHSRASAG